MSSNLDAETEDLAHGMVAAIQAGDVDGWGAAFAADGIAWHSYDNSEMPATDNVELLRGLFAGVVAELRYEDIHRYAIEDGYVEQHLLWMQAHNGATYSTGVCAVVHLRDGRIARLEEYLDSSVLQFGLSNSGDTRAG